MKKASIRWQTSDFLIYTCMFYSYRCVEGDNSPHFGINLGVDIIGTINEGDAVYATYLQWTVPFLSLWKAHAFLLLPILYDLMKDNVTAMIKDSYFYFRCFFHVVICMYYRICSSYWRAFTEQITWKAQFMWTFFFIFI